VLRRPILIAALAAISLFATAAVAEAVHWPFYGGDAGRSGFQPVDEGNLPVTSVYDKTAVTEQFIRNSIVTTAGGGPDIQRIAYGTEDPNAAAVDGRVHLQRLDNGGPIGPEGGTLVDDGADDADTFSGLATGPDELFFENLNSAGVSFADSSTAGALGVLYVVHNDDNQDGTNDIAITRIDESDGDTFGGADFAVPGTNGFTISSSPVLSALRAASGMTPAQRDLFFVARRAAGTGDDPDPITPGNQATEETRLFRITIDNPGTINASFNTPTFEVVPGGNPFASPALAGLGGSAYVVVSTNSANTIRTYQQDTLAPGPTSGDLGDAAQTPSVPVAANGLPPANAGAIYVAVGQTTGSGGSEEFNVNTRAYRLTLDTTPDPDVLTTDAAGTSELLSGVPAPALSVARESDATTADDRVVVTTGRNLFSLRADDLRTGARMSFADALAAGSSGFSRTTAATTGLIGAVTRDNGDQIVFRLSDAQEVGPAEFTEDPQNAGSTFAVGQPSISRRFIQFGTDRGAFVYRAAQPTITVADAEIAEGDAGTREITFTVTLSQSSAETVTVNYATANGTANAGSDYVAENGTVTFVPGDTTETFTVTVNGDTADESDETFVVNLSGAANASIADNQAIGTILDEDAPTESRPSITIGDASAMEGNSGTTQLSFTVTLSSAINQQVTVNYATAPGSATTPSDFTAENGTVTFAPNDTSETVTVAINGDTAVEPTEQFVVNLTNPSGNAVIGDNQGTGSIVNDDTAPNPPNPPNISVGDVSVDEGDADTRNATFTVSLSSAATGPVSVNYATANDTAVAGSDYNTASGTVSFATGEQSKTVNVAVRGDGTDEGNERFFVRLTNPTGGTIADGEGVGTINDDDRAVLTIGDVAVDEGTGGARTAVLTVSLSRPAARTITVDFGTGAGTAAADADFAPASGTLTFAPGETSKQIGVGLVTDDVDEQNEAFTVDLANGGAPIAVGRGTAIIADDDETPIVVQPPPPPGDVRQNPRSITVRVSPGRDRTLPYTFRTTGSIARPTGVTAANGCVGRVSVQVKRRANTISNRRVNLRRDCTFASSVTFRPGERLPRSGTLRFQVRFLGNEALFPIRAQTITVRFGR
jgi:hypothetical protein